MTSAPPQGPSLELILIDIVQLWDLCIFHVIALGLIKNYSVINTPWTTIITADLSWTLHGPFFTILLPEKNSRWDGQ